MKTTLRVLLLFVFGLCLCVGAPSPAHAEQPTARLLQQACVFIISPKGTGTGFFVAPGYVATNSHVVADAESTVFVANRR